MSRMNKTLFHIITITILLITALTGCGKNADFGEYALDAGTYLQENAGDSAFAENPAEDWNVILYAKAGADYNFQEYLNEKKAYVTKCYATEEKLDRIKATEWHRTIMAVDAAGGNPCSFAKDSNGKNINLVADGTYNWKQADSLAVQGCNGIIYALIALDSGDYKIPENAEYTKEEMINELLEYQCDNGAFDLTKNSRGDVDITAMAIQALAPYADRNNTAKAINRAIDYLSEQQENSGLYMYEGSYSSESSSQVIMALCAMGIDPSEDKRFVKNDVSVVDGLLKYRQDDGSFLHDLNDPESGDRITATQQAGLAMAALSEMTDK